MGVLFLHQEHGVVSLGVERVGGDDSFSQVQVCQQRLEAGDLIGFPSTSTWASTALASWSATASRCAACPSALAWRGPRTALPSTASACACRKPRPGHATRRYSLTRPPARVCLRTRYCSRSTGSGSGLQRRGAVQGAVRPMLVVVALVLAQDPPQMVLVPHEGAVQELATASPDPAFGDRVHAGASARCTAQS